MRDAEMNLVAIETLEGILVTMKANFKKLAVQYVNTSWNGINIETFSTSWLAFSKAQIQLQVTEFSYERYKEYSSSENIIEERMDFLQGLYIDSMRKSVKSLNEFSDCMTNLHAMIV